MRLHGRDRQVRPQTYRRTSDPVEAGDIRTACRPTDLPAYDVLAAGFPCQPFSIAGVSKKLSLGRQHGFEDEKSGNLFFEIVRAHRRGRGPPAGALPRERQAPDRATTAAARSRVIKDTLEDRGYNFTWKVIDAQPWVPQHRERTFIIGLHRDVFGEAALRVPGGCRPDAPRPTLGQGPRAGSVDPEKYILTPAPLAVPAGLRGEAPGSGQRLRLRPRAARRTSPGR